MINIDLAERPSVTSFTVMRVEEGQMTIIDEVSFVDESVWLKQRHEHRGRIDNMRIFSRVLDLLRDRQILPTFKQTGPGKRTSDRALRLGLNSLTYRPNGARECARRRRQAASR